MGADGQLLCSHSTNSNEMWVSLIEKAYLKVSVSGLLCAMTLISYL